MSQLNAAEKLFGTTSLDERQAAMVKKTYALLALSGVGAFVGGYLGTSSLDLVRFFASAPGWIVAMLAINLVPRLALWASTKNPALGVVMLVLDGFLSGLVLAPLLFMANQVSPEILPAAGGVTLVVFVAVSGYVMTTQKRFSAKGGLITGMFFSLMAAITLNLFLHLTLLGLLISIGVGIMGVLMLVYATSDVLNNPDYENPLQGALILFAALFNIFVSVVNILLRVMGGRRR